MPTPVTRADAILHLVAACNDVRCFLPLPYVLRDVVNTIMSDIDKNHPEAEVDRTHHAAQIRGLIKDGLLNTREGVHLEISELGRAQIVKQRNIEPFLHIIRYANMVTME